jgi:type VI secretion system secreted protein VgrG
MVAIPTQTFREIEVTSPLGKDVLLFKKLDVTEELGRLTHMHLTVLSLRHDLPPEKLIGQPMSIRLDLPLFQKRYFHGLVTQFRHVGSDNTYAAYDAVLQPWLWFLDLRTNCRVFQDERVPDIVKKLCREHGFSDFEEKLTEPHPPRRYCVQYRESDLNFVLRLMEQEGIYFYFKHEESLHKLVLCDGISAHSPLPFGYNTLPFRPLAQRETREEHVSTWTLGQRARPGKVTINTYDFKKPKANLKADAQQNRSHAHAEKEVYDYAGDYYDSANGKRLAKVRLEALHATYEQCHGSTNARGLAVGGLFTLTDHPRADQNREYLVVSAHHTLSGDPYESGTGGAQPVYQCHFKVLEAKEPYRTPQTTRKPVMPGPETATVVGLQGEEIWTDQYGRIKVQFHWDREGQFNEKSSCWVRVSQPWAGKGWGTVAIPRIGQEVVVDFLQGDPDRPLVMGRVFNEHQTPPYGLPQAAHMMGFRSNSTPGGGGHCEMVIHDQKGQEKIILHSQKDMETTVQNNDTQLIKANRMISVEGQHDEHVKGKIMVCSTENEMVLMAKTQLTLQVGQSRIVIKDGTIDISGPMAVNINVEG